MDKSFEEILIDNGCKKEEAIFIIEQLIKLDHADREAFVICIANNLELIPVFRKILLAKQDFLKTGDEVSKNEFLEEEKRILDNITV